MRYLIIITCLLLPYPGWGNELFSYLDTGTRIKTKLGISVIELALDVRSVELHEVITVKTPLGDSVKYIIDKSEKTGLGNWLLTGGTKDKTSRIQLVLSPDEDIIGQFTVGMREFQIDSNRNFLRLIDLKAAGVKARKIDHGPATISKTLQYKKGFQIKNRITRPARSSGTATIDVLFYYQDSMENPLGIIDSIVEKANYVYSNSGIEISINPIATLPVSLPYSEDEDQSVILDAMTNKEAPFSDIDQDLEDYKADLAHTIHDSSVASSTSCGIAYYSIANGGLLVEREWALGVTMWLPSSFSNSEGYCSDYTFAHEIGHNLGAAHNREDARNNDGTLMDAVFSYGYGHRVDGSFVTVMSYQSEQNEPEKPFFSTPLKTCSGLVASYPCGINIGDVGESDNASAFNNIRFLMAGYRGNTFFSDSINIAKNSNSCEENGVTGYQGYSYIINNSYFTISPQQVFFLREDGTIYDTIDATSDEPLAPGENLAYGLCVTDQEGPIGNEVRYVYWTYKNPVTDANEETSRLEWKKTYTVTIKSGANGSTVATGAIEVNAGENLSVSATPDPGYQVAFFEGTCNGSASDNNFTSDRIVTDCSIIARFEESSIQSYMVTPSAGVGGSISPSTPQSVLEGATTNFTITPNPGYGISNVGGSCGGNLSGNTFTTNAITTNCTVSASFESANGTFTAYDVKSRVKTWSSSECSSDKYAEGHAISNESQYTIEMVGSYFLRSDGSFYKSYEYNSGEKTLPRGYWTAQGWCVTDNDKSPFGTAITESYWKYRHPQTNEILKSDTLYWSSEPSVTYFTVTPSAGAGGSISPSTAQSIAKGDTTSFTILTDPGYEISNVDGTCGGSLASSESSSTYTTSVITSNCGVIASFASKPETSIYQVIPATICSAVDPNYSDKLQAREYGLVNTELEKIIPIICPIPVTWLQDAENIDETRAGFYIYAKALELNDANSNQMSCRLNSYEGLTQLFSNSAQVSLSMDQQTVEELGESLSFTDRTSFSVTCDIPPQAIISSFEMRFSIDE